MLNIETVVVEKGLCLVGSEDDDGCPQRNPEDSVQRLFGKVVYKKNGDDFLAIIVMGDETWLHHFEPKAKR